MSLEAFLNISIFGSTARGNNDNCSDFDVLAVVKDGYGKQDASVAVDLLPNNHFREPSISWYGEKKMNEFFRTGDLFAWHLHLESRPLEGFQHISSIFGHPTAYRGASSSIAELATIFASVRHEIETSPQNKKYELGICYVCFRNIAMSASWHLLSRPDFGRHSPYSIEVPAFPLSPGVYQLLWQCRIAGQRGLTPPDVSSIDIHELLNHGDAWIHQVIEVVRDVE